MRSTICCDDREVSRGGGADIVAKSDPGDSQQRKRQEQTGTERAHGERACQATKGAQHAAVARGGASQRKRVAKASESQEASLSSNSQGAVTLCTCGRA
jgi:hypothetical protein